MKKYFVVDTNIFISYLLSRNYKIKEVFSIIEEKGSILMSHELFNEITSVLSRSKFDRYILKKSRYDFLLAIKSKAFFVEPKKKIDVCRDLKDNMILELAFEKNAICIVTGDQDLLVLGKIDKIPIFTVNEFLNYFK